MTCRDPLPITLHPHSKVQSQGWNPGKIASMQGLVSFTNPLASGSEAGNLSWSCIEMQNPIIQVPAQQQRGGRWTGGGGGGGWWRGRQTTDRLRNYGQEGGRDVTCYKTPVNAANYTKNYLTC